MVRAFPAVLVAFLLILVLPGTVSAQAFAPSDEYVVALGDEVSPSAEVFFAAAVPAYLAIAPGLGAALVLLPRTGTVEAVDPALLVRADDGTVTLPEDAERTVIGPFIMEGAQLAFVVDGTPARLVPRPPLLGSFTPDEVLAELAGLRRAAAAYEPDPAALAVLRAEERPLRIVAYFGSWCRFCEEQLPKLLRVARDLDAAAEVELVGLPRGFQDEPRVQRDAVASVPTALVYAGGQEVGRLTGRDWTRPELAVQRLLADHAEP